LHQRIAICALANADPEIRQSSQQIIHTQPPGAMDNYKQKATHDRQVLECRRLLLLALLAGQASGSMRQQGCNYSEAKQGKRSQLGPEA